MNYGDKFVLHVSVTIDPLWIEPATSTVDRMGREQTETRMRSLADDLALFIGDALRAKQTPEEWAQVTHRLREHFMTT